MADTIPPAVVVQPAKKSGNTALLVLILLLVLLNTVFSGASAWMSYSNGRAVRFTADPAGRLAADMAKDGMSVLQNTMGKMMDAGKGQPGSENSFPKRLNTSPIKHVLNRGDSIELEDGSLWQVPNFVSYNRTSWKEKQEIEVIGIEGPFKPKATYQLKNGSTQELIEVQLIVPPNTPGNLAEPSAEKK